LVGPIISHLTYVHTVSTVNDRIGQNGFSLEHCSVTPETIHSGVRLFEHSTY